ncbi:hypothetical protein [Muribaculum sp. NM65_B17]|uniref:hypothetical protein n=1 Tax=Muribaculum sp. NM65_B17 TaxID=2516961 RepID=UPI0014412FC2|nr:hypothetical protein [Muribaculum sp. NM65_B17]
MNKEELKQQLDDELCKFCPWQQGEIEHPCNALCEGVYCDDALDTNNERHYSTKCGL